MLTFSSINTTHQTNLQFTDKQRLTRAAASNCQVLCCFFSTRLGSNEFSDIPIGVGTRSETRSFCSAPAAVTCLVIFEQGVCAGLVTPALFQSSAHPTNILYGELRSGIWSVARSLCFRYARKRYLWQFKIPVNIWQTLAGNRIGLAYTSSPRLRDKLTPYFWKQSSFLVEILLDH